MKSLFFKLSLFAVVSIVSFDIVAQGISKTEVIKSVVLNEERHLIINLPENYDKADRNFPVLFLLDGKAHIQHSVAATNYLAKFGLMPEVIIVALVNVDRTRDFSPTKIEKRPNTGGAANFLSFINKELVPYIDKNYKTVPFRILFGHSFGGEFATYALLEQPKLFDAYIAASPYFMYDNNYMVNEVSERLSNKLTKNKWYYMTVGDEPDYFDPLSKVETAFHEKASEAIRFKYEKYSNDNHATTPYLTLFKGLQFIYFDWKIPNMVMAMGLNEIDAHYASVSGLYKMSIKAPEFVINRLGYNLLQAGKNQEAIEVFSENLKRYPNSANVYDSMGEAYEKNNALKQAKQNYAKAYELGIKNNDKNTSVYKKNLERVSH